MVITLLDGRSHSLLCGRVTGVTVGDVGVGGAPLEQAPLEAVCGVLHAERAGCTGSTGWVRKRSERPHTCTTQPAVVLTSLRHHAVLVLRLHLHLSDGVSDNLSLITLTGTTKLDGK
jgi:hypothetical protein